jgi:hypothetical protein
MKKINLKQISLMLILALGVAIGFSACSDDFLNKIPKTDVTVEGFFKNDADLRVYVNGLYQDANLFAGATYKDHLSDNVTTYALGDEFWANITSGLLSADNATGWADWGSLRAVNLMLSNLDEVTGIEPDIRNYVGIARYFRAWFYIQKVYQYSDVPWLNKALGSTDKEVYKNSDPRALVVDSIMEDLEYAVANIYATNLGNKTHVSKYCALALLSRFALYEGAYRKYHSEINLQGTADRFLQRAASAAEQIMNSGEFEITGAGGAENLANEHYKTNFGDIWGSKGYRDLNLSVDLSGNKEVILWLDYNFEKGRGTGNVRVMEGKDFSLTRSLQESFLLKDGKPFSTVSGYATKSYPEVFVNRDPRMAEVIAYPGCFEQLSAHYTRPTFGGYDQVKFYCRPPMRRQDDGTGFGAIYFYRYAEVLLNYAEAKAEMGQLTSADLDKSINLLRARVDMPAFNADREVDQSLKDLYPGVSDNTILALRRERRVELACEGLRQWDIYRWNVGKVMTYESSKQGAYIPELGPYDVTANGIADIGIVATSSDADDYSFVPQESGFLWLALDETNFYLENGNSGYIRLNGDQTRRFEEPKFYYRPIPKNQLVLNPDLQQQFTWR